MDLRLKKRIITHNTYLCKFTPLNKLPMFLSLKYCYNQNFNCEEHELVTFCDVLVKPYHSLILAKEYKTKGYNPMIVTTVANNFDGSNMNSSEGMHDDVINLRTNFQISINANGLYPIKDSDIACVPVLTVIRDEIFNVTPQNLFQIGLIVASPIDNIKLNNESLLLEDYFKIKEVVETIFQTASLRNHDVIIFGDFGCKRNKYPVKDIIDIFNICILKYGHFFKFIVFCIPSNDNAKINLALASLFDKELVKPQNIELTEEDYNILNTDITNQNTLNQNPEDLDKMIEFLNIAINKQTN